ncbi:MAG TPA: hypothetical protein VGQ80_14130 [Acidimicrobiia bacterium]|nr:hypothetical protein [Acidimicrobiia bacterium]
MHDDLATSHPDHGPAFPDRDAGFPDKDAGCRRRTTRALVAGGLIAGFFLAGLGVAFARTASSHTTRLLAAPAAITPTQAVTPATPGQTTPGQVAPDPGRRFGHGGPFGHGGGPFGGKLFGFGGFGRSGGLHGEFTIKKPDGSGYQTMATQTGEVTAVSPSSITVKSEDGFSRTYSVDENTVVGSGRDGIGSVKTGDTVSIAGVVDGGAAKAAAVLDSTGLGKIGDHWGFPKHK